MFIATWQYFKWVGRYFLHIGLEEIFVLNIYIVMDALLHYPSMWGRHDVFLMHMWIG